MTGRNYKHEPLSPTAPQTATGISAGGVLKTMSHRTIAIAVDPSEYSEKAFDCKYKNIIFTILMMRNSIFVFFTMY